MSSHSFHLTIDNVPAFRNILVLLTELTVDIDLFIHRRGLAIEYAYFDPANRAHNFVIQSFWPIHAFEDYHLYTPESGAGRIVIRLNTQLFLAALKSSMRCDRIVLEHSSNSRMLRLTMRGRTQSSCEIPLSQSTFQAEKDCSQAEGILPAHVLGNGAGCSVRNVRNEISQFLDNVTRDSQRPLVEVYGRSSNFSRLHLLIRTRPCDTLMIQELVMNPPSNNTMGSLPPIGLFDAQLMYKIFSNSPSEHVSLHYDRSDQRLDLYYGLGAPNSFLTVRLFGCMIPTSASEKLEAECVGNSSHASFLSDS